VMLVVEVVGTQRGQSDAGATVVCQCLAQPIRPWPSRHGNSENGFTDHRLLPVRGSTELKIR
jgi:hypothetical protein